MKNFILRITAGFFCCLLALPSISSQVDSTPNEKDELNVDLIYPYAGDSPDTITPIAGTQTKNGKHVSPLVTGLSSHQWPQQGLNCQHVGRSPYSTAENPGIEKWRFPATDWCDGSPVINTDGTIYFGSLYLYAVYLNGTMKWRFADKLGFANYGNHPGIAVDGTIYAATRYGSDLCAVNTDGTEKWSCTTPEIDTSITIADDEILYYGHKEGMDARYPNGTLKWTFPTIGAVQSTPAVDDQNIIYFGSHDFNIYALYPNGTVKWNYTTDAWVHGSPTIAPDGTIYCGSDDNYLYAFYPNGTLKWKTYTSSAMRSSPSLDKDGNLYFGMWHSKIMSVAPDGTIRWTFPLPDRDRVWGSTAAISDDGTVYIGSCIDMDMNGGGEIIALSLDGTLKWRKTLCDCSLHSSPVISADGSVYICGSNDGADEAWGYLHAFGAEEPRMIELLSPQAGSLYVYGLKLLSIPSAQFSTIIGSITIEVDVGRADLLEKLDFYIDGYQYTVTEPPYVMRMDKRYSDHALWAYNIQVVASYKGGCSWTDNQWVIYFHLRKNLPE